eukprot:9473802-Pyramimonas_sp.AAC.1
MSTITVHDANTNAREHTHHSYAHGIHLIRKNGNTTTVVMGLLQEACRYQWQYEWGLLLTR